MGVGFHGGSGLKKAQNDHVWSMFVIPRLLYGLDVQLKQGFPLEFYFRGHKSPLTLIQGDILGDFRGQSYDT